MLVAYTHIWHGININVAYFVILQCGKTIEADGIEFIVLRVKGQSFMLHQIRKMIGNAIHIP